MWTETLYTKFSATCQPPAESRKPSQEAEVRACCGGSTECREEARLAPPVNSLAELYLESRHHSLEGELRGKSRLLNSPPLPLSAGSEQSQLRRNPDPVLGFLPQSGYKPFPSEEAYLP